MNIIVVPHDKNLCYCRPDTTWEKENRDLYIPEGVDKVLWAPVVFAKVCKAGKCVSHKFISRYYEAVGFGTLMYCNDDELAFSSCVDHTSILPTPMYNTVVLENEENVFRVMLNEKDFSFMTGIDIQKALEQAICKASEKVSLRIGDLVAVEIAPISLLAERHEGEVGLKANFNENNLFDFKVIF